MGSGLTLMNVRSTSDLLYAYGLSSAYRSQYVYEPSFALAQEPDIWELVRNDTVIAGELERSSKAVVRPWRIEPFDGSKDKPDRLIAAVCKHGLGDIDRFNRRRRRLSEARIIARTYGAILWQLRRVSLAGQKEMDWYIPYHIQDIDRRRMHWVTDWNKDRTEKVGTHLEMFNTNTWRWEKLPPELRASLIEYIHEDTEDRVGYGRGKMEGLYFYHYMKSVTFEKVAQGIDRWANGVWIGKIDGLRGASHTKTNEALRTAMANVLAIMRTNHQAIVEKIDDISVLETSGTGHEISMEFIHYLDESIARYLNGSVRAGGHNPGGSGARSAAETEQDESESYHQDDREDLDAILNRDLVGAFIAANRPQLEMLGLGKARRPKFSSEQIIRQDPETAVKVMNEALKKVPLSKRQYYEKIDCEEPTEDEEKIEAFDSEQEMAKQAGGQGFRDFGIKPDLEEGRGREGGEERKAGETKRPEPREEEPKDGGKFAASSVGQLLMSELADRLRASRRT